MCVCLFICLFISDKQHTADANYGHLIRVRYEKIKKGKIKKSYSIRASLHSWSCAVILLRGLRRVWRRCHLQQFESQLAKKEFIRSADLYDTFFVHTIFINLSISRLTFCFKCSKRWKLLITDLQKITNTDSPSLLERRRCDAKGIWSSTHSIFQHSTYQ